MAKKKVIDLRAAEDVPAGDVNITYNGVRIAGFSEDTDATLKTGMKRVEHDIEVEYTKNAPAGNIVNITNNSSGNPVVTGTGLITADGIIGNQECPTYIPSGNSKMYLFNNYVMFDPEETSYIVGIDIPAESDVYSVIINGTTINYRRGYYAFSVASNNGPITGQTYNIVITDKV